MVTYYSQKSGAATDTTVWNTAANGSGSAPASFAAMDNNGIEIQASHAAEWDGDTSGWATGVLGIMIRGHATTPGMLYSKYSADGMYYIKLASGYTIQGSTVTNRGRLLANSDGTWGNTGALPFGRKFIIECLGTAGTAKVDASNLDIKLYDTEPANLSVRTYGTIYKTTDATALSVDYTTDTFTRNGHGWANGTAVSLESTGNLPAPLQRNILYWVVSTATNTFQLAFVSGGTAINLTDNGTGTVSVYNGSGTGTALNVLEDVTGDPQWISGASVVLASSGPENYNQIRTTINGAPSSTVVTLTANGLTSLRPGARVWLMTRNVAIRSNTTAATNILDYTSATFTGSVLGCEIRSVAGTGTTFYGNGVYAGTSNTISGTVSGCSNGVNAGTSHTISGTVSGCSIGVNYGTSHTISGTVSGCSNGVYTGTSHTISGTVSGCSIGVNYGTSHTISGTVSGCSNGVYTGTSHTISGTVSGCSIGVYAGTSHTISGTVSGCSNGVNTGTSNTISGTVSGCSNGVNAGTSHTISGTVSGCSIGVYAGTSHTISGTVSGCSNGVNAGTSHTISGTVSGCSNGVNGGTGYLRGAVFSGNSQDILTSGGVWAGWAAALKSATQVAGYKHSSTAYADLPICIGINDLCDASGAIQQGSVAWWCPGGVTISAPFSVGTHGTPPITLTTVHVSTAEDSDRDFWVEFPIFGKAGLAVTVTVYHKVTSTSGWTTAPCIEICDPNKAWKVTGEKLAESSAFSVADTDWHTSTATYTPSYDRPLEVRVCGCGGNAGGTGTGQLYWWQVITLGASGTGGLMVNPGLSGGLR